MFRIIIILSSLVSLASCGKKSLSEADNQAVGRTKIPISKEDAAWVMSRQKMRCASLNAEGCPKGVARLFMLNDKEDTRVCTVL